MRKLGMLLSGIAVLSAVGCSGGSGDVNPEQEAALRKKLSGPPTIPGHEGAGGGARTKEKQAQATPGAQAPAGGQ